MAAQSKILPLLHPNLRAAVRQNHLQLPAPQHGAAHRPPVHADADAVRAVRGPRPQLHARGQPGPGGRLLRGPRRLARVFPHHRAAARPGLLRGGDLQGPGPLGAALLLRHRQAAVQRDHGAPGRITGV